MSIQVASFTYEIIRKVNYGVIIKSARYYTICSLGASHNPSTYKVEYNFNCRWKMESGVKREQLFYANAELIFCGLLKGGLKSCEFVCTDHKQS